MTNSREQVLAPGKIAPDLLNELIDSLSQFDKQLVIPPGTGLDAAGLRIGERLVAVSTDPITFATEHLGTYVVAVNINDVACLGCRPRWFSSNILLPVGTTKEHLQDIWWSLCRELERYDIQAIGGHTEVTEAVKTPVLVGQMIGEAIGDSLLDLRQAQVDDSILLWQPIAIEGTALLADERIDDLSKTFSAEELQKMRQLLHEPGICVWPLVKKLLPDSGVVGLHDPTEGGIATALHEMADVSNCGISIDGDSIAIRPETLALAEVLGFDPLGFLASGSLLIVCRPDAEQTILNKLKNEPVSKIGCFTAESSRTISKGSQQRGLPRFTSDELIRALAVKL